MSKQDPGSPHDPSFKLTCLPGYDGLRDGPQLLLPHAAAGWIDEEAKRRSALGKRRSAAYRKRSAARRAAQSTPAFGGSSRSSPAATDSGLRDLPELPISYAPQREYPAFERASAMQMRENLKQHGIGVDDRKRIEGVYGQLVLRSPLRRVGMPHDIEMELSRLARQQPHFATVIQFVRERFALAGARNEPPRIPPILLAGPAGVGKTHFAHALAQTLGVPIRTQPYDNAETSSTLLGSDRHWANSHHGVLFELICLGEYVNPILILDELDKARAARSGYDPMAPLHTILEPSTCGRVRDISLDFEFDASLATFIATANDLRRIPETLRSRFRVFWIELPTGATAISLAEQVVLAWLPKLMPQRHAQVQAGDEDDARRRLAVALAHLSAREIRQALEDAAGYAIANGRHRLTVQDLPGWVDEDASPAGQSLH